MDKEKAKAIIDEELGDNAAFGKEFDRTALTDALKVFGVDEEIFSEMEDTEKIQDFAAAIEFYVEAKHKDFATAVALAAPLVVSEDYIFAPKIYDENSLGVAVVNAFEAKLPEGFEEYFDFERLGEDELRNTEGYITHYGFFMLPDEWLSDRYYDLPDVEIY